MINLYNTLEKKKTNLIYTKTIKIYSCGVTVYDKCHIGHARIFLFFNSLINYLKYLGIKIIYIRNITDVDDKIIKKAIKTKNSLYKVSEKYTKCMHKDIKCLKILEPSFEPKATCFIKQMILLIDKLMVNSFAYKAKNNDIYFNINKFDDYGKLSGRKNFKNSYNKKYIKFDFVLWKSDIKEKKFFWYAPWSSGRPGWHTECSAMALYYGVDKINIHGGGQDLIFPHHENELTQCEAIKKIKFIDLWLHIGHVKIDKKKMSKKNKNFILISEILKEFDLEVIKLFFLLSHYKNQISFSYLNLFKTKKILLKLYNLIDSLNYDHLKVDSIIKQNFLNSLNEDFNTPKALSIIFNLMKKINKNTYGLQENKQNLIFTIKYLCNILDILNNKKSTSIKTCFSNKILQLIEKRNIARKNLEFDKADHFRKILEKMSIKVQDTKNGSEYIKL